MPASVVLRCFCSILLMNFILPVSEGQILEHAEGRFFSEEPFFNPDFIRRNDIRRIEAPISTKREMDRVRRSGTEHYYEFDKKGRLQRQYETYVHSDTVRDTTFIDYEYGPEGRIQRIRRNDLHGFYAYDYSYDEKGRIQKERYLRIENEGPSRYEFNPGKSYVIDEERYEYRKPNDSMLIQDYYNSQDRIYRRRIHYRDSLGYLQKVSSRYMITHKRGLTKYDYDEKGRVIERIEDPDRSDGTKERYVFEYDEVGNLLVRDVYRDDSLKLHHEYLYRDSTMLLDAEIRKNEETLLITITRFKYEFYERPRVAPMDSTRNRMDSTRKEIEKPEKKEMEELKKGKGRKKSKE
jgi:hypothetical protein